MMAFLAGGFQCPAELTLGWLPPLPQARLAPRELCSSWRTCATLAGPNRENQPFFFDSKIKSFSKTNVLLETFR